MKITERQLRQIIKEEMTRVLVDRLVSQRDCGFPDSVLRHVLCGSRRKCVKCGM